MNLKSFSEVRDETSQLKDRLGTPIDPGILETVTFLRLLGINTVGSCEGHLNRITGGPYVMFESPSAGKYKRLYQQVSNRQDSAYKHSYSLAVQANIHEVQKVLLLLEEFYKDRVVSNNQRLIVRCFDASVGKLMCQGSDLAHVFSKKEREILLKKNQDEMHEFTLFLKQKSLQI